MPIIFFNSLLNNKLRHLKNKIIFPFKNCQFKKCNEIFVFFLL